MFPDEFSKNQKPEDCEDHAGYQDVYGCQIILIGNDADAQDIESGQRPYHACQKQQVFLSYFQIGYLSF